MVYKIKETVNLQEYSPASSIMDWVINGAEEHDARNEECGYDSVVDFIHEDYA